MSFNPYKRLRDLFPAPRLQVGTVVAVGTDAVTIELPGGSLTRARGEATVGARVYIRDGVIEGLAPELPIVMVEV